jgi:hypothetical protein
MVRLLWLLALIAGSSPRANAQSEPLGAWLIYGLSAPIPGTPLELALDTQLRYEEIGQTPDLWLGRAVLSAPLTGNATVTAGYLRSTNPSADAPEIENRFLQELTLRQPVGRVSVAHRFRYEQRLFDGEDLQTRYRYRITGTVPLTRPRVEPGALYATSSAEVMLRGAGRAARDVYDRTRINAALGLRATRSLDVRLGYQEEWYGDRTSREVLVSLGQSF